MGRALVQDFSDTSQLVRKSRTRALPMKWSLYTGSHWSNENGHKTRPPNWCYSHCCDSTGIRSEERFMILKYRYGTNFSAFKCKQEANPVWFSRRRKVCYSVNKPKCLLLYLNCQSYTFDSIQFVFALTYCPLTTVRQMKCRLYWGAFLLLRVKIIYQCD